jgi:thioesterase domain-containing protein
MSIHDMNLRNLVERFLSEKIPLTLAMGVQVVTIEPLTIEAPVQLNSNHLGTAFGGSINAVATLAGYGSLWLKLREDPSVHVIIAESSVRFLRPVRETIRAVCCRPRDAALATLKSELAAKNRGRIRLRVRVEELDATAAEFEGLFVAVRSD